MRPTLIAGVVLALATTACGSGGSAGDSGLSGSLNISGSSTVEPITSLVAEKFQTDNPGVHIAVDGPGTSDGFQLFCDGKTDVNDASRPISEDEVAACAAKGVEYIELAVGQDALTVIGNPANPVSCLTFGDLYALFGPESDGFATWSDANALDRELGGNGSFSSDPLTIVAPGEESGTYGSFIDLAISDIAESRGAPEDRLRSDYQLSADDNVIVENAGGTASGLGFVGYAYAENAGDRIKEFQIDGGDGCVSPSAPTVNDGTYPLSRTLYLYVSKQRLAENAALARFVDFYLSDDGIASVEEVDYVSLHPDDLASSRAAWEAAKPD